MILNHIFYTSPHIPLTPPPHFLNPHIKQQTHQLFPNLHPLLQAPPPSFQTLVKPTLFIKHMQQFPQVNQLYAQYFHTHKPAPS
ncbi:Rid family hydrolase, partial [Bacillus sp. WP8]|uniref:Rid family hydrolase n=1 Tax=Bacillus sp. WP8 TaxID=756828 RepID=UPI0037C03A2E